MTLLAARREIVLSPEEEELAVQAAGEYYESLNETERSAMEMCIRDSGTEYYLDKHKENLYDFYVYQECGTPVDDENVDNTKRQWAYVRWSLKE